MDNAFRKNWKSQIHKIKQATTDTITDATTTATIKPSLTKTFLSVFGFPFMIAGLLKLVHDSCIFVGPNILNKIILFLGDPSQPRIVGIKYVVILFIANLTMSLCLRQYFWWCYRVGE